MTVKGRRKFGNPNRPRSVLYRKSSVAVKTITKASPCIVLLSATSPSLSLSLFNTNESHAQSQIRQSLPVFNATTTFPDLNPNNNKRGAFAYKQLELMT
jgi:hypothetical protein